MLNIKLIVFLVPLVSGVIGERPCGVGHKCVPYYFCTQYGKIVTDGSFLIDTYRKKREADTQPCALEETCCEMTRDSVIHSVDLLNLKCASTTKLSGLVRGGSKVLPGKFPFMAALVLASNSEFFCGGSLITEKHVLTAAHCIQQKGSVEKLHPDDVLVLLGRHNLALTAERKSVTGEVEKILIHEDWKFHTTKYDADLAILVMDRSVTFSPSVSPICITTNEAALSLRTGRVAGWGQGDSGYGHENLPKMAKARAISGERCFELQSDLGPMYSSRMFCAKGDNASPCRGDSGGSFFVNYEGRLIATGIVSVGDCDPNKYMLYTKISNFTSWILRKILENP